jgi:hypothetical protein
MHEFGEQRRDGVVLAALQVQPQGRGGGIQARRAAITCAAARSPRAWSVRAASASSPAPAIQATTSLEVNRLCRAP